MPRTQDQGFSESGPSEGRVGIPLEPDGTGTPLRAGDVIAGKYEIRELIGQGGIGFVAAAVHLELGELVALKFLRRKLQGNAESRHRFAKEARAAARIQSEHVARVFDIGTLENGAPFIVMEYLEGHDLADMIRLQGALPVNQCVEYALQACEGLVTAHASGIIHRDVKPENLFVARRLHGQDVIKLLDFGISKVALTDPSNAKDDFFRTLTALGSPPYMAPEQIRGADDIDARVDIWSLGCVLYELLTGRPPFSAPSLLQVCAEVLETTPKNPSAVRPEIPTGLGDVVMRCLEKRRDLRFQNVAEVAEALAPFAPERAHFWAERCSFVFRHSLRQTDAFPRVTTTRMGGPARAKVSKLAFVSAIAMATIASAYAFLGHPESKPTDPRPAPARVVTDRSAAPEAITEATPEEPPQQALDGPSKEAHLPEPLSAKPPFARNAPRKRTGSWPKTPDPEPDVGF